LSASYPAAVAPLPFLPDPSAGRDGDARAMREKRTRFRGRCETKGLGQGTIRFKSDRALSVLARDAGELAANYQDAVKAVLTLRRPATMGREKRGFFRRGTG
jgi:hypothetical protein